MELKLYLTILWQRKLIILVTVGVTLTMVILGTLLITPTYAASTTLRIAPIVDASVERLGWDDIQYADRLMNTYSKIVVSSPVQQELMRRLDLDKAPQIEAEILVNTELMQITVEDQNQTLAATAANTLAEILITQVKKIYNEGKKTAPEILSQQLAQLESELNEARKTYENLANQYPEDSERLTTVSHSIELKEATYNTLLAQYEQVRVREAIRANTISVIEPATIPDSPTKPRWELNLVLGLGVGLVGGVGLAFLFEHLNTGLYTAKQIKAASSLAILGQIPTVKKRQLFTFPDNNSPDSEAFRCLRTNLFIFDQHRPLRTLPLKTLLITSTEPGEGKSTILAKLAVALAQTERKILIIDSNLRRPNLHNIFSLTNDRGLSSILRGEISWAETLQDARIAGIQVLTSGPVPPNPADLLGSIRMTALIEQASQQFDLVLLDSPALPATADTLILTPIVDGILLVVGRGQAKQDTVHQARQQLTAAHAKLIGVIVNRAETNSYHHYYQSCS